MARSFGYDGHMQAKNTRQWIGKLAPGVRWGILLALALLLTVKGRATSELIIVFAVGGLWALLLMSGQQTSYSMLQAPWLHVAGDALLGVALFFFNGTLLGSLVWAGLLPVASAGFAFGINGGLLAGFVTSAGFGLLALVDIPLVDVSNLMRGPAIGLVLAGFLIGIVAQRPGQGQTSGEDAMGEIVDDTEPIRVAGKNKNLCTDFQAELERVEGLAEAVQRQWARVLHDGAIQSVAAIAMRVSLARRMIERNVRSAEGEMKKVEELARSSTKEIRHLLFSLHPQSLQSSGLPAAFQDLAEQTKDAYGQILQLEIDAKALKQLDFRSQRALFYIALEGLNNALNHAQGGTIWLRAKPEGRDWVRLDVEDDGMGFETGDAKAMEPGTGLWILRTRTEILGGTFEVISNLGSGTRLTVRIPVDENLE